MSQTNEQLETGSLRKYIPRKAAKFYKKWHARKMRRKAKNPENPNPQHNRYKGWVL